MPRSPLSREPKTAAEWQAAVDAAAAARAIAECMMYGLLAGGPVINVERCDEILERGARRGVRPSKPVAQLAVEFVKAVNEDEAEQLRKPKTN